MGTCKGLLQQRPLIKQNINHHPSGRGLPHHEIGIVTPAGRVEHFDSQNPVITKGQDLRMHGPGMNIHDLSAVTVDDTEPALLIG